MRNLNHSKRLLLGALCLLSALVLQLAFAQGADVRSAVEAANQKFVTALARGDAAAMARLYTPQAQVLPPQADVVRGPQAIEQFWKGVVESGVKRAALKTLEVEEHGDTAYETGTCTLMGENESVLDQGKYLVIWKRVEGSWKLHRDIWNTSRPAAP